MEGIRTISSAGIGSLEIRQGPDGPLTISADDNVIDKIIAKQTGTELQLGVEPGSYTWKSGPPSFELTTVRIDSIDLSGQTHVTIFDLESEQLEISANGQCTVTVHGRVKQINLTMNGQCKCLLGDAEVESISGNLNGQCVLEYAGDPALKISGAGANSIRNTGSDGGNTGDEDSLF